MTTVVELPDSADTLRYRVQVGKSLQQEEVRISVNAKALIQTRDNNQAALLNGFQYHEGETLWSLLCEGRALDLVREPANTCDIKAVRVEWRGVCRTLFRQIPEAKPPTRMQPN